MPDAKDFRNERRGLAERQRGDVGWKMGYICPRSSRSTSSHLESRISRCDASPDLGKCRRKCLAFGDGQLPQWELASSGYHDLLALPHSSILIDQERHCGGAAVSLPASSDILPWKISGRPVFHPQSQLPPDSASLVPHAIIDQHSMSAA